MKNYFRLSFVEEKFGEPCYIFDNNSSNWTAFPSVNCIWPVNVFTGTGSSRYEKLLQAFLRGRKVWGTLLQANVT